MVLILDIDDSPPVLTTADLLAVDDDRLLRSDNRKGNKTLFFVLVSTSSKSYGIRIMITHVDLPVDSPLLIIKLVVVVGVHLQVVESKLLLDTLLESLALLESEGISLSNDRNDIDHIRELLEHDNVDRLQGVT